jgi:hypothetical protein
MALGRIDDAEPRVALGMAQGGPSSMMMDQE